MKVLSGGGKPKRINPQQYFEQEVSKELKTTVMPWDNDLKQWYPTAIKALKEHSTVASLRAPAHVFPTLRKELQVQSSEGLMMNVVASLCNNNEWISASQLGMKEEEHNSFIELNNAVAKRWNEIFDPIRMKVLKRVQLAAGAKSVIAEA